MTIKELTKLKNEVGRYENLTEDAIQCIIDNSLSFVAIFVLDCPDKIKTQFIDAGYTCSYDDGSKGDLPPSYIFQK